VRLLLETTPLQGDGAGRGLGRYVRELQAALESQGHLDLFTVPTGGHRLAEFAALPRRQRSLRQQSHDLLYAPTPLHVPLRSRTPWVASILDTIPLDVVTHRPTGGKTQAFYRLAARADAILTLSCDAADRITERLGVPRDRIVVAPLPSPVLPDAHLADVAVPGLPSGRYAVGMADVSTPDPRKRIPWYSAVGKRLKEADIVLVLVGPGTDGPGAPAHTIGLGRLSDLQWSHVLARSTVFVYSSAFEGQGLPPLEAMAHGVPVVAMDNTAVREVVGFAGVLVPELHPPGLAAAADHSASDPGAQDLAWAVLRLLEDTDARARLATAGAARAATFDVTRFRAGVRAAGLIACDARRGS